MDFAVRRQALSFVLLLCVFAATPSAMAGCDVTAPEAPQISLGITGFDPDGHVHFELTHNDIDFFKIYWRGGITTEAIMGRPSPFVGTLNGLCLSNAEPLRVEGFKCQGWGYDDPAIFEGTVEPPPGDPEVDVEKVFSFPGASDTQIDLHYKFPNTATSNDRQLIATLYPSSGGAPYVVMWAGVGGNSTLDREGGARATVSEPGLVRIKATTMCTGASNNTSYDVGGAWCKLPKDPASPATTVGPACSCTNDPVNTASGDFEYDEVDPLPAAGFLPFVRHFNSGTRRVGRFGTGWSSPFDAFLRASTDALGATIVQVVTESGASALFELRGGAYVQIAPRGNGLRGSLLMEADGSWTYVDAAHRLARIFSSSGAPIAYRDIATGHSVQLGWTAGTPSSMSDSFGNWTLDVQTNAAGYVSSIAVAGHADLVWTYTYDGVNLVTVTSPAGVWRTYEYAGVWMNRWLYALSAVRDAAGRLLEEHSFDGALHATNSTGPSDEIQSIQTGLDGRITGERKSLITYKTGRVETQYQRAVDGRFLAVEIDGGCSSCGAMNAAYAFDANGNLLRAQDASGYIRTMTYAGDKVSSVSTFLRPADCDPATDSTHCRQTTDTLASATLIATAASDFVTYAYNDPFWPDRATQITSSSVLQAGEVRQENVTYDAVTGVVLTRAVSGWTGQPARAETYTTSRALYDGTEVAAFDPGGSFESAWLTLPQPLSLLKSDDGPRTDVSDVTTYVYYPVDNSVPAAARGRLAAARNAAGHITRYEDYDVFGHPLRVIDRNGVEQSSTYDALGRLQSTTLHGVAGCDTAADPLCAIDLVATRTYDGAGPLQSDVRFGGGYTSYEYDSRARLTAMSRGPAANDLRERMEYTYDAATGLKNLERILAKESGSWVEKKRTSYTFDSFGRTSAVINADSTSVAYTYDSASRLATVRDENHATPNTTYTYDPAGRMQSVQQTLATAASGSITTSYGYDRRGNLTSVEDPNGNVTTYVYDDFGRMVSQVSPVTGTANYDYDAAGNLVTSIDGNGATTIRTYDVLSRVLTATSTLGWNVEQVTSTYDDGAFGLGHLSTLTSDDATHVYQYDRRGLLLEDAVAIWDDPYVQKYAYDADGNRISITYPSGRVATYSYDYAGRPITLSASMQGVTTSYVTSASYLPFGPVTSLVLGNGLTESRTYDNRYAPASISLSGAAGTLANHVYTTDPAGNITQIADALNAAYTRDFGYDDLNRLTSAITGVGLWGTGSYSYDAMGNMLTATLGSTTRSFTYQGTTPRIATTSDSLVPMQYDDAGNELNGPVAHSTESDARYYSPRNLLWQVDLTTRTCARPTPDGCSRWSATTTTLWNGYDGRGVRVLARRFQNPGEFLGGQYSFYTPELALLATYDGAHEDILYFAGRPIGSQSTAGEAPHYTLTDHLGTPILQTDAAATITWQAEYDPFGTIYLQRTGTPQSQPLRLPGQQTALQNLTGAEETYNIFRWYRSGWGRYTQSDPVHGPRLVLKTGRVIPPSSSADGDQYTYTGGNPIRFTDPDGLYTRPCSPGDWSNCQGDCDRIGKRLVGCGCYGVPFCFGLLNYSVAECKDYQNGCPPCPPPNPPVRVDRVPPNGPSTPHFPCKGDHWHYQRVDQGPPPTCICRYTWVLGGCL